MSDTNLLTVREAAARLGVSVKTVRRLYQARYLRHVRIGSAVRFRLDDLDEYITENLVEVLHLGEVA